MAKHYKTVSFKELEGETIVDGHWENEKMPDCKHYQAYTVITKSGREFVFWNSWGEQCLNEIIKD